MGLPLFVAPVESDLPSKSDKCSSTSPYRSGIRRHARPDPRDRRAALRRHMSIRDRLASNSLRQSSSLSGRTSDQFSTLNEPSTTDSLRRPRPFREVLREVVRNNGGTQERFEEHFQSLFTGASLPERDGRDNSINEPTASVSIWGPDPVPSYPRSRQPPYPWASQVRQDGTRPSIVNDRYGQFLPARPARDLLEAEASRRRATEGASHLFTSTFPNMESVRNVAIERMRETSGLGDRERSLSPEVWDTLLSTLTPDPQGPSAGSSFASTVASQSAGVSSGTALTTPEGAEGEAAEQPCESGCENSDSESPEYESQQPQLLRNGRRRVPRRRVRLRDPDHMHGLVDGPVDGPIDGPIDRHMDLPTDSHLERLRALTAWGSERRTTSEARRAMEESSNNTLGHGNLSLAQFRRPRHGWIGQLSVGTSDEDMGTDRRSLNRENSGEEEWEGMQHIVRSLARREDIPDEWWAEAGLSRTIP